MTAPRRGIKETSSARRLGRDIQRVPRASNAGSRSQGCPLPDAPARSGTVVSFSEPFNLKTAKGLTARASGKQSADILLVREERYVIHTAAGFTFRGAPA